VGRHGRRTAALVLVLLMGATGCGVAPGPAPLDATEQAVEPVETVTAPPDTEPIFEADALLHPGKASGTTVRTRVDVTLSNIGAVAAAVTGRVTLLDTAGKEYFVAAAQQGGVLDFGTLAPGEQATRDYVIDLPIGARVTAVTIDQDGGVPIDGPARSAA
jgi:hypothetical protein